jgi:ABC-type sugar transport system ATPase subunit
MLIISHNLTHVFEVCDRIRCSEGQEGGHGR